MRFDITESELRWLPSAMRLKEARRTPMWNGPIECRLFRFDLVAGAMRVREGVAEPAPNPVAVHNDGLTEPPTPS